MDRLVALNVFRHVVEEKSFAGAARRTGLSRSAVSKNMRELEEYLGVTLVRRTTRSISLSDAGAGYYERVSKLLSDLKQADDTVADSKGDPTGSLRISAPMSLGLLCITPLISKFLDQYPKLSVDMTLNDSKVDLLRGHFDLAIRGSGKLEDSSIIARCVGKSDHVVCASPDYFETRGTPSSPEDLKQHDCLIYTGAPKADRWEFEGPERPISVMVNGKIRCNNSLALRQAALEGHGILRTPKVYVAQDLKSGKLRTALEDWPTQSLGIWIMYPEITFVPQRLRVFIDFMAEHLSRDNLADYVPGYMPGT